MYFKRWVIFYLFIYLCFSHTTVTNVLFPHEGSQSKHFSVSIPVYNDMKEGGASSRLLFYFAT